MCQHLAMTLEEYIDTARPKMADLAAEMGCDPSFVSHVKAGNKPLPMPMAIRLYRKRGIKLGPIADASAKDIEVLARFHGEAAA